ncbi:MAG: PKD domain-containing protein [Bacteroidetes bacterium]|nr:PKD domain-containing protein [Bacteroidota bacterium]
MRFISILFLLFAFNAHAQTSNVNWIHQGPNPFPVNVSGQINGIGRISQVKFHASDTSTVYAVSASGGLYKSMDHGKRWDILLGSTKLPRGSQASVCIDRTRDSTIYLGSGDANYYGGGTGVWKSIDGGSNFFISNTGMGNRLVIEILQDPLNANVLIAATNNGIYKSVNAGANWILKSGTWALKDMEYKPGSNGRVIYTTSSDSLYRSLDYGETWQPISNGIYIPAGYVGGRGMRVAVCPADTNIVYVAMVQKFCTIFKSIDGGNNFIAIKDSVMPNLTGYNNVLNDAGQGNYNFDFNCDPLDPTVCFVVSHNIFRSTNSGATWTQLSNWWAVVHTDMHQIAFSPHIPKYHYNINDGGVWFTQNAGTNWVQRSDGLAATEIYTAASSNIRKDIMSIGTQDNGELYRDTTGWKTNRGGDWSKKMSYDFKNPVMVYYSDGTRRNVVGGGNPALNLPFTGDYSAIAFSKEMIDYCWVAKNDSLFFTRDVHANPPTWTKIADFVGSGIIDIHSSYADTNLFFSINRNGKIFVSNNILASTPSFVSYATPATTNTAAAITSIRKKDSVIYISCGNRIYRSNNYGANFTNISLNYPTINVKELYHDLYTTDELVIALNSDGVWYHTDTMTQWKSILKNLPTNCGLNDLSVYNNGTPSSAFRNSYYGRGVWEFPLDDPSKVPNALFSADSNFICAGKFVNFRDTSSNNPTQWLWSFEGGVPSTSTLKNPTVLYPTEGTYKVRLTATNSFGSYTTEYKNCIAVLRDICAGVDTVPGKAIQVKGTEDNTVPALNIVTNTITIAGWVKLNGAQAAYSALYSMNGDSTKNCFTIISPNRLGYHWRGESGTWSYNTGPIMPYNEWCHIAMVISPTQAVFYVNGVGTSRTYTHKLSAFNTIGYVGSELGNNSRTMNALIDELTIYNKSLNQSEIRELMHLTKRNPNYPMHSSDSALIAYYQFNEAPVSGNKIFDKISRKFGNLDALTSRVKSTVPIGGGRFYRTIINAVASINQPNVRTSMNFPGPTFPNGEIVIAQLNNAPDTLPNCANYVSDNKSGILDNYGSNSSFNAIGSWHFTNIALPQGNYLSSSTYQLFSRKSFEDSLRWTSKGLANSILGGINGKINFNAANNIISAGQFIATNASSINLFRVQV